MYNNDPVYTVYAYMYVHWCGHKYMYNNDPVYTVYAYMYVHWCRHKYMYNNDPMYTVYDYMYVHLIDPVYKGHFVYVLVFEIISCQPGVRSSLQKRLAVEFKFEGRTILFVSVCNKQQYYYNIDVSTLPAVHCYQWTNLHLWLILLQATGSQENVNDGSSK